MKKLNPLEETLNIYDNLSHAARELGVTRQDIYYWKNLGYIPHKRGLLIEQKTKGKIKATDIWQAAGIGRNKVP